MGFTLANVRWTVGNKSTGWRFSIGLMTLRVKRNLNKALPIAPPRKTASIRPGAAFPRLRISLDTEL